MKNKMISATGIICVVFSGLFSFNIMAQQMTLDLCYEKARANYPLVRQYDILQEAEELNLANISKGLLPQIGFYAQATYQSGVITLPFSIPNAEIDVPARDQYKAYFEVSQNIYDGGLNKAQKQQQKLSSETAKDQLEVEIYKLKENVLAAFFGIILSDEQLSVIDIAQSDLDLAIQKAQASVDHGVVLRSSLSVLKAERLKNDQRKTEINFNRIYLVRLLSVLTGENLDHATFVRPEEVLAVTVINRPELRLIRSQMDVALFKEELIKIKNRPRLSAFVQAGVGRPAFNFLSNDLDPYYIGGIRLTVPLTGFYTKGRELSLVALDRNALRLQEESFLFHLEQQNVRQNTEVEKLNELIAQDDEIIVLRSDIKRTALAQLENGVINSSDYLRELNAEEAARQNKALHGIQKLQAIHTQLLINGN